MCLTINNSSSISKIDNQPEKSEENPILKSLQLDFTEAYQEDNIELENSRFNNNQLLDEVFKGNKSIKKGSSGESVKVVQQTLTDMGFYVGDKIDGKFGNQTSTAVKNFQNNRGIKETGIVDKETIAELEKVAPDKGKKLWDSGSEITDSKIIPSNSIVGTTKRAKIVVDLSEHRLFLYNDDNSIKKVYSVATGKNGWADKRGGKTKAGIKVIDAKIKDPSKIAMDLWPESKGKAFGTKLLALSFIDPKTGKKKSSGEELHGTYTRNSLGTDASHGCMRMSNEDIEEVFSQVKSGTIIKVQD